MKASVEYKIVVGFIVSVVALIVVNNEEAILAIVRSRLENYGYQVLTGGSGLETIARFTRNADAERVIVSDRAIPFMEGHAAIHALRKVRPDAKIIVASGSEQEVEDLEKQAKSDAAIPKPFTNENLLEIVHKVLASKADHLPALPAGSLSASSTITLAFPDYYCTPTR